MKKTTIIVITIITIFLLGSKINFGCTNFLITKGASVDGSTMISYAADSHVLYGELYIRPAADYPDGAMLEVYEWDTGKFLKKIKQVKHTYSVVGNMNEHQVAIGETTYGGRHELVDTLALMDYGSLMYIALQRAKTAREAMKVMTELAAEHGFCSHGESFSISDPNEVWIMEMIGKGVGNTGAVWVARLVPDGYVCAHANQARITTFSFSEKNNWDDINQTTYHSADVISFARKMEYFKGKDEDFSFSDTYAPVDFGGARFCEIRVWAMFNVVNKDMGKYWEYAKGHVTHDEINGYANNRMPLWIKPDKKVSVSDMMNFMRDHLENTELDMRNDIGAGPFQLPYRWRGLTWKVDSIAYCNERATATQQTGFSFVTQSRSWLPDPIGGIFWFSVDDAASSVYVPMYCGITKSPESYAEGNGSMLEYSSTSAFWAFNFVSNFAYLRYSDMIKDVIKVRNELENKFIENTSNVDKKAEELYKNDKASAIKYLTDYSSEQGNNTVKRWQELGQYLLVKYIDGNIKKEKDGKFETNGYTNIPAYPYQLGYPEWWYKKIIEETGDRFKVIESEEH
ncbi:MAG: C69 family dipeptidase [Bacteroidales bacterium]|nr:C69 family dipeptidase [Bacteroidales bacterium]